MLLPPGVHEHFPRDPATGAPDVAALTPLFRQYLEIKAQYPQALLLYRLGDFYELFGPDAVQAAEILGLTLTSRACGKDYKVAMCGVPHHAATRYIKRLVTAGLAAAVCEQTEDPALAKGLVERAVTRVITAGTLIEDEYLAADSNNYLAVVAQRGSGSGARYGVALLESSGGRVELFELPADGEAGLRQLFDAVLRLRPAEILLPAALAELPVAAGVRRLNPQPAWHSYAALPAEGEMRYFLERYFAAASLAAFGLAEAPAAQAALFALVRYLKETFKAGQLSLAPRLTPLDGQLYLDSRTLTHLELSADDGGGVYRLLNRCSSAAGRRELKRWLAAPLAAAEPVAARHDAVQTLLDEPELAQQCAELLGALPDVERIVSRVCLRRTHPKEVRALVDALPLFAGLRQALKQLGSPLAGALAGQLADFSALKLQLDALLADDPPLKLSDGGVLRAGADAETDRLRELVAGGQQWVADYEQRERERSGIRTLKLRRTEAFGYFIEVSKANLALVPQDYQRKQTLVSSERFVTPELAARETELQGAAVRLQARERELFEGLLAEIESQAPLLSAAARAAAAADVLCALARTARELRWVRPELLADIGGEAGPGLEIVQGRHPLVEQAVGERYYAASDCYLDQQHQQLLLLTGPNMGGKSTYLRMAALIAVLAQLGSFVPAQRARLPLFTRIYTRVGAQDYLARGQSTFMVEMLETAEILNTCGPRSLVLLDEVGRGTSTYDGISLAKAVLEYLHELPARPLTLFATHFFELTDLELLLPRVRNFQVLVARDEAAKSFVFLYKVAPGAASDSFGIEVAALAGLPASVVARARQILAELEDVKSEARERARRAMQLGLFEK